MPAKYLLDSTLFIDYLNGVKPAGEWFSKLEPGSAMVSVITRAEVLARAGDQWETVVELLDEYGCLSVGPDQADIAAGIRGKYRLKLPDAFQAALAQEEDLTLVTRDEADFKKIADLDVKIPYKI